MLKAVLDTNIIVSGTISSTGSPYEILEAWRNHKFMLVVSPEILIEVERVFEYPKIKTLYNLDAKTINSLLATINKYSLVAPGEATVDEITADPSDNMLLACAKEAAADFIVSGDNHLLNMGNFQGVPILTAALFIETIKQRIG